METQEKQGGNVIAIATMFALFFMIAFVTNFAASLGVIAKAQFQASNALSQLGNFANFFAYLFMGIPGGLILKRKGYKFTSLTAVAVGFTGVGIQLLSGYIGSFAVYVTGAFVAGFSMCMLNLVTNPLLNTLGGGGNKGNQLVQFGCSLNSVGATLSPMVLGWLIGEITKDTAFSDAAPALMIAMGIFAFAFFVVLFSRIPEPHMETAEEKAFRLSGGSSVVKDIAATLKFPHFTLGALAIFFYIVIEVGIPSMANLYMTEVNGPGYVGGRRRGGRRVLVLHDDRPSRRRRDRRESFFPRHDHRLLDRRHRAYARGDVRAGADGDRVRQVLPAFDVFHGALRPLHFGHVGRHLQHGRRGLGQVRADGLGYLHGDGVRRRSYTGAGHARRQDRHFEQLLDDHRASRVRPLLRARRLEART